MSFEHVEELMGECKRILQPVIEANNPRVGWVLVMYDHDKVKKEMYMASGGNMPLPDSVDFLEHFTTLHRNTEAAKTETKQ